MEKLILIPALALSLVACNNLNKELSEDIDGHDVVEGSFDIDDGALQGTGMIIFKDHVGANHATLVLDLDADLKGGAGSTVTVFSHGENARLSDGIQVTFVRRPVGLAASIRVGSQPLVRVNDARLSHLNGSSVRMTLEIHNSGGGVRVVTWPTETPRRTGNLALFDTTESGHIDTSMPTVLAPGTRYGLSLREALLKVAKKR